MNALTIIAPEQLPGTLTSAEIDRTMHFARSATAPATLVAYASDYKSWVAFATARSACPMPPYPGVVAAWLSAQADAGRKASSIGRAAAALAFYSKQAGIDPPVTASAGVRQVLKGIRREIGAAKQGKSPIVADMLLTMLKHCPDTLAGKRDAALLALGFAAALRRSELCALTVDDLTFVPDGLRVRVKRSKTDQTGETATIAVIRGVRIRPVAAVEDWLAVSGLTEGPLLRAVALGDRMSDAALKPDGAARIIKRYCKRLGIDPSSYSGHSLRSGLLTSAAEAGSGVFKMMEVSRHRSMSSVQGYVKVVDAFKDHCTAKFM